MNFSGSSKSDCLALVEAFRVSLQGGTRDGQHTFISVHGSERVFLSCSIVRVTHIQG
jgi:hypothetical protein